jgi:hypothetical protein
MAKKSKLFRGMAVGVLLLLCIGLGLYVCRDKDDGLPKPPLILPISLEQAGSKIEKTFRVVDHNVYYFTLRFSFKENDQVDKARVRNLLGDYQIKSREEAIHPGIPIPVILRVFVLDEGKEYEVYTKEIDPILTSWGSDHFDNIIGYTVLKKGVYKAELENLRSSPEFNEIPVSFAIGMSGSKQMYLWGW